MSQGGSVREVVAPDAARVVGRVAVAGLERGRLVAAPVRARVVARGEPQTSGPAPDCSYCSVTSSRASSATERPGDGIAQAGEQLGRRCAAPSVSGTAAARSRAGSTCAASFAPTTCAQSSAPGSPRASSGPAERRRPSRSAISTAVSRRAGKAAVSSGSISTRVVAMTDATPSSSQGPRTSPTVKSPVATAVATGQTRLYCASSVVVGRTLASASAAANVRIVTASTSPAARRSSPRACSAARIAPCDQRQHGYALR